MSNELISKLFVWALGNPLLDKMDDSVVLSVGESRLAFSTDSFIVDPIFFPGGDIGDLAVNGTVNDLAMSGARPLYLSLAMILEEGFPLVDLRRVVESIKRASDKANVIVVTGDTKVLNKGKGDKVFINTTGIGILEREVSPSAGGIQPGDKIILSGAIAEHGMAVLSQREGLRFETSIVSDTAPLNGLVDAILEVGGIGVHAMRDPTRGGVAATLNEFSVDSSVGIRLVGDRIPVQPAVAGACEFLGIDPLYVANEGKMVAAVAPEVADTIIKTMKAHPLGRDAVIVGEATREDPGLVTMQTSIGGWRIVDMMVGEQLPRIC
jgi:hydrogenase expression/formation protein HypE